MSCECGCGAAVREGRRFKQGHNGRRPLAERFWEKVDQSGACWLWTGSRSAEGYGTFRVREGEFNYAHRIAYEMLVGPIPTGLVIDHLCRVRACCNPTHLEPVEQRDNVRRGLRPYGLRTECRHGHDITDVTNVYTSPSTGARMCRTCAAFRSRRLAPGGDERTSTLAEDLARYNTGVARARAAYTAEQNGMTLCRRKHPKPLGGRCVVCDADKQRRRDVTR